MYTENKIKTFFSDATDSVTSPTTPSCHPFTRSYSSLQWLKSFRVKQRPRAVMPSAGWGWRTRVSPGSRDTLHPTRLRCSSAPTPSASAVTRCSGPSAGALCAGNATQISQTFRHLAVVVVVVVTVSELTDLSVSAAEPLTDLLHGDVGGQRSGHGGCDPCCCVTAGSQVVALGHQNVLWVFLLFTPDSLNRKTRNRTSPHQPGLFALGHRAAPLQLLLHQGRGQISVGHVQAVVQPTEKTLTHCGVTPRHRSVAKTGRTFLWTENK